MTYFGSAISADGKLDKDLDERIGQATGAYKSSSRVWLSRKILIRIYRAAVLTVLLYGVETWATIKCDYQPSGALVRGVTSITAGLAKYSINQMVHEE